MFVIGYIFIALEHQTGINKTAIALLLGILLWVMYIFSGPQIVVGADPAAFQNFIHQHPAYEHLSPLAQVREYILNWEIIDHLGNISEVLFYLIGALTSVETIDVHQGFDGITRSVKTKNKKKLLWLVAFITFFMSSVLDNMTSAIVMMMLIQKLLSNNANAGFSAVSSLLQPMPGEPGPRSGMSPQSCSGSTITLLQVTS